MTVSLLLMVDVDLVRCWKIGKAVFTLWLLPLGFAAKFGVLRGSTRMSVRRSVATDVVMTGIGWALLVGVPLPVLGWVIAHRLFLDHVVPFERADSFSWIAVLAFAAILGGALDLGVVRVGFRQRLGQRHFWIFVAVNLVCLTIAGYWAAMYILRHPPIE